MAPDLPSLNLPCIALLAEEAHQNDKSYCQRRAESCPSYSILVNDPPTMPREVSDIKQFIEICRRKDAKCTLPTLYNSRPQSRRKQLLMLGTASWPHKTQSPPDQIQSPVLAVLVHASVEGFRKGG